MTQDPRTINDETFEEVFKLTNGESALCFQCGVCTASCPWALVKEDTFSIRNMLRTAQLGLQNRNQDIWYCTTCGQCEAFCPRGVNITNIFRALRFISWKRNLPQEGLSSLLWSVFWNNNPWEQPPSQRNTWARNLNIPQFNHQNHEILYYAGCAVSYDFRAQKIALSLVDIFRAAEVSFGIFGNQEPCSGEEVLSIGHNAFFQELSEKAAIVFTNNKVNHLVTSDPHSFDAFKNHYKSSYTDIASLPNIQHYTEYLDEIIKDGRLCINHNNRLDKKMVTYHDPCYLSRHNHIYQAPRNILGAIPGLEFIEMKNTGVNTLCCGGGGGRMWVDTAPGERFADLRVAEAQETGAEIIATACPYCISCLEDSIHAKGIENLKVLDIAEIVAFALE